MTDMDKLITSIMKEAEKDGEPVTREEAKEMAEMEIKAKSINRYEQSMKPRKKAVRERKVDEQKVSALMRQLIEAGKVEKTKDKKVTYFSLID